MLSGVSAGSVGGDLLVLAAAALYALQIALDGALRPALRPARVHDRRDGGGVRRLRRRRAAPGRSRCRSGATVWAALLVTGIFASALGYLVQAWAQQRTSATRTALIFALEPVFAGIFGYALAGDRLGALGWAGCAVILAGIAVAEPAAAATLARLVRVRRSA